MLERKESITKEIYQKSKKKKNSSIEEIFVFAKFVYEGHIIFEQISKQESELEKVDKNSEFYKK